MPARRLFSQFSTGDRRGNLLDTQNAAAEVINGKPTTSEHFGFH